MEKLDTVVVSGKPDRPDPLEPVFGQVFSVIGHDPANYSDKIKSNVAAFRKRYPGYEDTELVEMARNQMPQMVASAVRAIQPNQKEAKQLEDLRMATARDKSAREFLSYGATAVSGNEEARKNFVNAADEPYNAMKEVMDRRQASRLADVDLAGKQLDIYGKAEKAGLEQNQFDPNSTESAMMRKTIEGQLRSAGRADLIPQLEGKSAAQLKQLSDTITPIIEQKVKLAGIGKTAAETRGIAAEAGLKELTTTAAKKAYNETGSLPQEVQGKVLDDPTIKRISAAQTRLDELTKRDPDRTNIKATINSIERTLAKLSPMSDIKTNPALGTQIGGNMAMLLPEYQKLAKDLAILEGKIGKEFGATDASKALGSRAAPDISKYPSTIRSILAQMRAEIQRDDLVQRGLFDASKTGKLGEYNEVAERAKLRTYTATGQNNQVTATFSADDVEGIKKFFSDAKKRGMKIEPLSTK